MSSEFNTMVEMHRHAANKVEVLKDEIDQLMEQNGRLKRDREAAESESARLRQQVQRALHGRVKDSPDECNEATGPSLGQAMERITEREPKQVRPFEACPTCGRRKP